MGESFPGWGVPPSARWVPLPHPDLGRGTPWTWEGGTPCPGLDGGTPHPRLDEVPPPIQDWMGYPAPQSGDRAVYRALAMQRARRRIFLFVLNVRMSSFALLRTHYAVDATPCTDHKFNIVLMEKHEDNQRQLSVIHCNLLPFTKFLL